MKRQLRILFVTTLVIIISSLSCISIAMDHHVTRGDFFTAVARGLELDGMYLDAAEASGHTTVLGHARFSDYDYSDPLINVLISKGYLYGNTDGTLTLENEITRQEMIWFMERLIWPTEKVIVNTPGKTKYIAVPVEVEKVVEIEKTIEVEKEVERIVEKIVKVEVEKKETTPCAIHKYALDASGKYTCVACKEELRFVLTQFRRASGDWFKGLNLGILNTDKASYKEPVDEYEIKEFYNYSNATLNPDGAILDDALIKPSIAFNAKIYIVSGETLKEEINFDELFVRYCGKTITGFYHLQFEDLGEDDESQKPYFIDAMVVLSNNSF